MLRVLLPCILVPAALASAYGSVPADPLPPAVQAGLDDWRFKYGQNWRLVFNEKTQQGRMLFGGGAFLYYPTSVAQGYELSRTFLEEAFDIFGVEGTTLVNDRNLVLPLASHGTTDKVVVRLRQEVDGVPVEHGWVDFIYDLASGHLLAIDCMALPGMESFERNPSVPASEAESLGAIAFEGDTGEALGELSEPQLVFAKITVNGAVVPTLAWSIDAAGSEAAGFGSAYRYLVSAQGGSQILRSTDLIHSFLPQTPGGGSSSKGRVLANVTEDGVCCEPGHCCWLHDQGDNHDLVRMPRMRVELLNPPGPNLVTNALGEFTIPGTGQVRLAFEGPYVNVDNHLLGGVNPPDLTLDAMISGNPTIVTMNPVAGEIDVAQANAFYRVMQMRGWVRGANSQDTAMDSSTAGTYTPYEVIVNGHKLLPDFVSGGLTLQPFCYVTPGFYNQYTQRVVFSASNPDDPNIPPSLDPICSNGAMATVIWHEMGHWLNDRYDSGNAGSGRAFGEGLADAYSLYLMDYHQAVYEWIVRDGDNLEQTVGDCEGNPAYHPSVAHGRGKVLMGAFWKMRKNLKFVHGESAGGELADALFLGWLNAFDQDQIHSIISRQLMVLDDDDRNLDNETPNFVSIERAFTDHGFAPLSATISICEYAP